MKNMYKKYEFGFSGKCCIVDLFNVCVRQQNISKITKKIIFKIENKIK